LNADLFELGADQPINRRAPFPEPVAGAPRSQTEEFTGAQNETAVQRKLLRNISNSREGFADLGFAENSNFTGINFLQTQNAAEQGGFAGAIRANQGDDFTSRNFQVDPGEDWIAAKGKLKVANLDDGIRGEPVRVALFAFVMGFWIQSG
jgi:hypothetical protein